MTQPFRVSTVVERAAWQMVQAFLGAWVITSSLTADQAKASALAGAAAAISALFTTVKALLLDARPTARTPLANLAQRVGWTFLSATAGILPVTLGADDLDLATGESLLRSAIGAGAAAVLALAKNLSAEGVIVEAARRGDTMTTDLP